MKTKQYGGEGTESYSGKKSDTSAEGKQHGGEGTSMKMGGGDPNPNKGLSGEDYCGPGKYLSVQG